MEWKAREGVRMSTGVIHEDHVTSAVDCLNRCAVSPDCDSVNFRSTDKRCQLVSHVDPLTVNSAHLLRDDRWQWWSTSFTIVL